MNTIKSKFMKAALGVLAVAGCAFAAPNPNFHIYIAYGQSNMSGNGEIVPSVDQAQEPKNFIMLALTRQMPAAVLVPQPSLSRPENGIRQFPPCSTRLNSFPPLTTLAAPWWTPCRV